MANMSGTKFREILGEENLRYRRGVGVMLLPMRGVDFTHTLYACAPMNYAGPTSLNWTWGSHHRQ